MESSRKNQIFFFNKVIELGFAHLLFKKSVFYNMEHMLIAVSFIKLREKFLSSGLILDPGKVEKWR